MTPLTQQPIQFKAALFWSSDADYENGLGILFTTHGNNMKRKKKILALTKTGYVRLWAQLPGLGKKMFTGHL